MLTPPPMIAQRPRNRYLTGCCPRLELDVPIEGDVLEQVERVQGWAAILNGKKGAERDLNILLGDGQLVQGGNLVTRITNIVKKMPQDKLFQLLCNLLPSLSPVHVAELMVEIHLSEDDLWIRACELMEPLCINAMVRFVGRGHCRQRID